MSTARNNRIKSRKASSHADAFANIEQAGGVFYAPDLNCQTIGGQMVIKGGSECPNRGPADPSFYKELYGGGANHWANKSAKRKSTKRRTKRTQKKKRQAGKRRV
jgi:hypothetical protein